MNQEQLYSVAQIRQLEHGALQLPAIPKGELMLRAGSAAFAVLRLRWPQARRLVVIVGGGNNGGDGLVLADLARDAGLEVSVRQVGRVLDLTQPVTEEDAILLGDASEILPFNPGETLDADVIVDALLGIGLKGQVREEIRVVIEAINHSSIPVLAMDVPSGLDADAGISLGACVNADVTVTFIAAKRGLFTGDAVSFVGEVIVDTLGLPAELYLTVEADSSLLAPGLIGQLLLPRKKNTHKGTYGHVLVVGGDEGMPGAVLMAAQAAARVGAGLVTIATHRAHAAQVSLSRPELMCHGVSSSEDLTPLLAKASVIVLGPGLGRGVWGQDLWQALINADIEKVVDADALFFLAASSLRREDWVLTPHAGEAGVLLGIDHQQIGQDRYAAIKALQQQYSGTVVLKGAGSLIHDGSGQTSVCRYGHPGMATGGMGDVLSGMVGGLLAQGLTTRQAAEVGVLLHALAADTVAQEKGGVGMLAMDVVEALPALLHQYAPQ